MSEVAPLSAVGRSPAISWRSIGLGLVGTTLICALTPYNDYALNNTFLVGNNLPLGVVTLTFLLVLIINGPLWRWAPRYALSSGELTVALVMTLVSCGLPSSGLMRFFPPAIVVPFYLAQSNPDYMSLLERLDLPPWLFPAFDGTGARQWAADPIASGFYGRWTREGEPIPLAAWIQPAIAWGVFLFALYGALLCLVVLVRRQWTENERLPFPLAQIQLALVEQPRPGRWLNDVLSRRAFWIAFGAVFLLHAWNGFGRYWPQYFIRIPTHYDLHGLFTEPPLMFANPKLKDSAVLFTVVGVTYFMSSSVAISVWFFFLLHQLYRMGLGLAYNDPEPHGQHDQHAGGLVAFALVVLWIGRRHWRLILAQAFRGPREGEPRGRYLSYPAAFWGLVACSIVMVAWLIAAGATPGGAALVVVVLLAVYGIAMRIIAETGLVHIQLLFSVLRPWSMMGQLGISAHPVPTKTFFLGALVESMHFSHREDVSVYASHGLRIADSIMFRPEAGSAPSVEEDSVQDRRTGRRLMALLMLALLVGYVVSFASTLWTEYRHGWTKDAAATIPINAFGADTIPRHLILEGTLHYERPSGQSVHSPIGHFTFGFAFTSFLSFMRLRFAGWPLHPIGYLMLETFPGVHLWFSVFVGWLCKSLIIRLGGASLYLAARPFFLGLIVGESLAAGVWLITSIVLSTLDVPYHTIQIMPG